MKKTLAATAFMAMTAATTSQVAATENVTWINPWKPGGNADHIARVLAPVLDRQGVKNEVSYTKSCAQALDLVRNGAKNSFVITVATSFIPLTETSFCNTYDINKSSDQRLVYSSIHTSSYFLCVAPGKNITTADLTTRPLKVGMVTGQKAYFDNVLANMRSHQITALPYSGAGDVHRAAISGDIDMWFGLPATQVGGQTPTCLFSSSKTNSQRVPFIGALTTRGDSYPEMQQMFLLLGNQPTATVDRALREAMKSPEFQSYVQSLGATHTGLGTSADNQRDLQTLFSINEMTRQLGK